MRAARCLAPTMLVILAACSTSHAPADAGLDATRPPRDAIAPDAPPGDAPDAGCTVRMGGVDPSVLPACPFCGGGHCVPGDLLGTMTAQLAACDATSYCVPDELIRTLGTAIAPSCRSLFGAEGRCVSRCLPAVRDASVAFPRDACDETHVCVPCFDPSTGDPTGACEVGCDPGPAEPPLVLAACCEDRGVCIPEALVPAAGRDVFEACTGSEPAYCIPRVIASSPGWTPPPCTSASYGAGACLHDCMPAVRPYRPFLAQDDCPDDLLCVPCTSPLSGEPTGACAALDGGTPMPLDAGPEDAGPADAGLDGGSG